MIQPRAVLHEQIIYKKTCFCTHWCTFDAVCLFSQLAVAFGRKTCWEVWRWFSVMQPRPSSHVDTFWGVLFGQTPAISFLNAAFGQPRHQKSPANTTGPGMNLFNKTRSYKHETRSSQKLNFWPQNVAPFYVVVAVWICLTIIDKKQPTPNKSLSRLRKNVTFHEASARPGHLPAEGPSYHRSIFDGRGCNLQTRMCIVDVYAGFIWIYYGCSIIDVSDSKNHLRNITC